jgi:hypothetical protein
MLSAVSVKAQFADPLVITINGDFWTWYGDATQAPARVTEWGFNSPPVMSPDNSRIAYNSTAQMVVAVGGAGGGALPSNIWVADPRTGSGTRVVDQPEGASFMTAGVPDLGVVRSDPAWSPDGGRLVWAEQTYPTPVDSLVVHDINSGLSQPIVTDLPPSPGVPAPREVLWGSNGIVVRAAQLDGDSFSLYAPDGVQLSSFQVGGGGRVLTYYALMAASGREVLGVLFNDGVWELFDLFSGASQLADGIPEMYSLRAGDGSLSLSPTINEAGGFSWRVLATDGNVITTFASAPVFLPRRYTISPDGQAVAYSDYFEEQGGFANTVNVWQGGVVTVVTNPVELPLVGAVTWGATGWRVRPGVG